MEFQETVEITTPLTGKKVVLRGYITGEIKQAVDSVFQRNAHVQKVTNGDTDEGAEPEVTTTTSYDLELITKASNVAISMIVLSVDGVSENVLDLVLKLPAADTEFVKREVDKIQDPLPRKVSSTSPTPSTPTTPENG